MTAAALFALFVGQPLHESALTTQEVLLDAGGPIFAEAFGNR